MSFMQASLSPVASAGKASRNMWPLGTMWGPHAGLFVYQFCIY